jgi:glycogen synthase
LFVSPYYAPFVGGTSAFLVEMARRLVAAGHHATVLTTNARRASDFWASSPAGEPSLPAHEVVDGVTVERLPIVYPWPVPYHFGVLRRAGHWLHRTGAPVSIQRPLLRLLAARMPPLRDLETTLAHLIPTVDLIEIDDSSWDGLFTASAAAARCFEKPIVVRPLMHLGDAGVRAHFQMAHQVDAYRSAAAVLALSHREKEAYVALGVAAERVHLLPMGINANLRDDQDSEQAGEFRRAYGLAGPVVAFLGANTYDKGAFTLTSAVARLIKSGLAVTLVCVGPGREQLVAYMERQSPESRALLLGRIHILGVVDETTKHGLLAACTLLALPSQVDTFGIVLLEAWLHGKPVIGANAGGIPEVVRDGETGLLVPFDDVEALATAIQRLVESPTWAAQLGEAGRQQVLRRYTWDRTYRTLSDIYATVLR